MEAVLEDVEAVVVDLEEAAAISEAAAASAVIAGVALEDVAVGSMEVEDAAAADSVVVTEAAAVAAETPTSKSAPRIGTANAETSTLASGRNATNATPPDKEVVAVEARCAVEDVIVRAEVIVEEVAATVTEIVAVLIDFNPYFLPTICTL